MKAVRIGMVALAGALVLAVGAFAAQGMHGHGGPMGEFGFGGHMLGFFADYLDLSSAQQEQIKAIWQKEKPTIQAIMQQMSQFHGQMRQLEESGSFDEAKVRALAAQQSQAMTEAIVQKARIKSEMLQVLTPEQKIKLQQLEAKHEQRMQQHMQKMQEGATTD